ncbi:FAD-dependent oxidoreductase [Spirosoma endbachense]|uniref:Monooxygenase n=1 Tax=Spirosoma endbachense TaxID=2666025 RepID=A0A6P1VPE1_9BACT|nr:NAD(P)/FAD-dependent oxidoreductase [Spirosoma endbachense]QHV93972.1 monooxygenase [Spirosoma endbachense]
MNNKAIIIGCGIAGPVMALALKRVGIDATIYEAQPMPNDTKGAFLGISPNGLNVINDFLPLQEILTDYTPGKISFFNAQNKPIGLIDNADQKALYGSETVQLKRGLLNGALRKAAQQAGIAIEFGKRLTSLSQGHENTVTAFFEDGSQAEGNLLIGCDGIRSATRSCLFQDAVKPSYTGLLSTGGFTKLPGISNLAGSIRMTFGQRSFFAYALSNKGEVWWFNNFSQPDEPHKSELSQLELAALKEQLLSLHKQDPYPIAEIIRAAQSIEIYPVYDIPFLPQWHKGRVCLIGDAAHATAPHIGQGASLALEDTIVLAKCIRDLPSLTEAFERFQSLRQERVQTMIRQARKVGDSKAVPNAFQRFFRDLLLPFFVKMEAKKMGWVYSYKTDWESKIT